MSIDQSGIGEPAGAPGTAGVTYTKVGEEYFEARRLKRYARVWSLWALGVGAVISGHYSGWNLGFGQGFGWMFFATIIIAVMYLGLIFSLAEMSPALPHTGGAYSFARTAMGPWAGYVTGIAENIEYVLTPAVIVFFIGSYLSAIFGTGPAFQPVYWILAYALFVALNVVRGRAFVQGDGHRDAAGACGPRRLLRVGAAVRAVRLLSAGRSTSRRTGGRANCHKAAARCCHSAFGHLRGSALRGVAVPCDRAVAARG